MLVIVSNRIMKESLIEQLNDKVESLEQILILLLFLMVANIATAIIKYVADRKLKGVDLRNIRQNLIIEREIKVQENIYKLLESITLFDPREETDEMLSKIIKTERYINSNNLFISKKINKCVDEILDYLKSILTDYRKKDISKETKLLNEFINTYRK